MTEYRSPIETLFSYIFYVYDKVLNAKKKMFLLSGTFIAVLLRQIVQSIEFKKKTFNLAGSFFKLH